MIFLDDCDFGKEIAKAFPQFYERSGCILILKTQITIQNNVVFEIFLTQVKKMPLLSNPSSIFFLQLY
jgi:hypothetical protein